MFAFSVTPAAPSEFMAALQLLLGEHCEPQRGHDALTSGDLDPARVFVARDAAGRLCGAALVQAMPGALGVAWPPRGESPAIEDALTAAACTWLRNQGVKVCQAFAASAEVADLAPLKRHGFRHITQLVFMRGGVDQNWKRPEQDLRPLSYHPDRRDRFLAVLLATHEGTRDCPELNGNRTPEELVAGFGSPHRTADWNCFVDSSGEMVGVALLEASPGDVLGITYLGVVPSARGRGIGGQIVWHVLREASRDNFAVVELSVDARNEPALRLYDRHGFTETDRREVWLAHFPGERRGVSPT